jgi:hypothetical protein
MGLTVSLYGVTISTYGANHKKLKLLKLKAMSTQMCFRMNRENMNLTAAFIELARATLRCISEAWNGDSGTAKGRGTPHEPEKLKSQRRPD